MVVFDFSAFFFVYVKIIFMKNFSDKYEVFEKINTEKIEKTYGKNFDPFLANLLFARKIEKKNDVENFLNPKWENNHNPFLFNDMKKITARLFEAIKKEQKILIFSDYDTDGIPGGALLFKFFEKIKYKNYKNFIPNRNKDGYGLTTEKAEKIKDGSIFENSLFGDFEEGENKYFLPELVITIDCGISDIESAKILKENSIDLIITDHHRTQEKIPDCFGILNHKIPGEKYPDKNLCGCGVIFKFVQAMILENKKRKVFETEEGFEKWLLDLVAISTVCDMVPLVGENRTFVKYGKIVLQKTKNIGISKIIEKSRIDKNNISAEDLGFMIGPRINAASRLEDPFFAFEALVKNNQEGIESAEYLESLNNKRKYLTAKIMKEVWKKLEGRKLDKVIVIGNKEWPLGVLGLIAGKIADKYARPAFVWSKSLGGEKEKIKGSCRSGSEFSVFSIMEKNKDLFLGFGGHTASGGFEIAEEKIHFLEQELSKCLDKVEKAENKKVILDAKISLDDVNIANYNTIEKLAPYGMANQKPVFLFESIETFLMKDFGKNKEHLELVFKNSRNFQIKAIAFFYKDKFSLEKIKQGEKINLIASFELNRWNGGQSLRLKIEDIF